MRVSVRHALPGFDGESGCPPHGGIVPTTFGENGRLGRQQARQGFLTPLLCDLALLLCDLALLLCDRPTFIGVVSKASRNKKEEEKN